MPRSYSSYADEKHRKPFRWWYDSIIDYRLANPSSTNKEQAAYFKVSERYFTMIVNSDMFKARWEQRRALHNETVGAAVQQKMLGSLDLALDIVAEQLRDKRTAIPFQDTTKYVNSTLERLGYGVPKGPGVQVNNFNGAPPAPMITQEDLAEARALLRRSENARVIDAVAQPSLPSPSPGGEAPAEPAEASDAA